MASPMRPSCSESMTPRFGKWASVRMTTSPSPSRGWAMKNRLSRQWSCAVCTLGSGSGIWWTKYSSMGVSSGTARLLSIDQCFGVEVERVTAVPVGHRHEHVVAPRRLLDEHRRRHCHDESRERVAPVLLPAVVPGDVDTGRADAGVVLTHERVLVGAPLLEQQTRADEVAEIGDAGPVRDSLPVDHRDRRPALVGTEQQIVEAVVAVLHGERHGPVGEVDAESRDEPLAQLEHVGIESVAIAIAETVVQARD